MKNKTIQYNEMLNRSREIERVQRMGIQLIVRYSKVKIVIGFSLVGYGAATILLPTGSVFAIGVGVGFILSGGYDLFKASEKMKRKLRLLRMKLTRSSI